MLLVLVGKVVDSVIEFFFFYFDNKDLIIDGGNFYFLDIDCCFE